MELSTTQSLPLTESSPLSNTIEINAIEEIGIVIAAQDLTPTMMSQDFLVFSGIVPRDWELSEQPILNPGAAQLHYTNGVSIAAQPRTITFSEALNDKQAENIVIPEIAIKYIEKLPHADYLGISFSPKMLLPFPQNPGAVRQYIADRLLGVGTWKNIGKVPVQAGINLMYLLDHCQLTINVGEARLQQAQQNPMAALLFSGSFNYNISPNLMSEAKLGQLKEGLSFWQSDLNGFRDLVINKFLAAPSSSMNQDESVFPSL
jgi:hypothetical protein